MKNRLFSVLMVLAVILCSPLLRISSDAASVGDLNDDGIINAQDASLILSKAAELGAGIVAATEEDLAVMDINQDQSVNVQDANLLLMYTSQKGTGMQQLDFTDYIALRQEEPAFYGTQSLMIPFTDLAESFGVEDWNNACCPLLVTSPAELDALCTKSQLHAQEFYLLNACEKSTGVTLAERVEKYDSAFFEAQDLLVLVCADSCINIQWIAEDIRADGNAVWTVSGKRYIPAGGSPMVSSYLVFVETNKAVEFASSIQAEFTEIQTDLLF